MATTISIPEDLADELYERKARGESYADVIRRLLEEDVDGVDESGGESPEPAETPTVDTHPSPTPETRQGDVEGGLAADVAAAKEVLPGSGTKLDEREAAFDAVLAHLRENTVATPEVFKTEVYPEHPARYETANSWWKNAMYAALGDLADRTEEIERPDETGEWEWQGGDAEDADQADPMTGDVYDPTEEFDT